MKLTNILYRRQYKIQLSSSTPNLDLKSLDTMGIWINPTDKHYLLTLKSGDDPNVDFAIFEKNLEKKQD